MKRTRREVLLGSAALAAGAAASCAHSGASSYRGPASWGLAGGVTGRRATVKGWLRSGGRPRLWCAPLDDARAARTLGPVRMGPHGVAAFELEGLTPDRIYLYRLHDAGYRDDVFGRFRTFPEGPASFSFCTASCARTGSDHPVFDTIRELEPLFFLHLGDFHYENIGAPDADRFAKAFLRVLSSPRQSALYRNQAFAYVWDDHDFGPNNSDRTSRSRVAALRSYLEHVPHYPLAEDPPRTIHQAFTVGRVRFLLSDARADRDPPSVPASERTMLGEAQKAWLVDELSRAKDYGLVVWASPVGWLGDGGDDDWGGFPSERAEIARAAMAAGVDNLLVVSGDAHMLAIDDGSHDTRVDGGPGFPIFHCAALDQRGSDKGGPFSHPQVPGGGQFGRVRIEDDGAEVRVTLEGRNAAGEVLMRHTFTAGA